MPANQTQIERFKFIAGLIESPEVGLKIETPAPRSKEDSPFDSFADLATKEHVYTAKIGKPKDGLEIGVWLQPVYGQAVLCARWPKLPYSKEVLRPSDRSEARISLDEVRPEKITETLKLFIQWYVTARRELQPQLEAMTSKLEEIHTLDEFLKTQLGESRVLAFLPQIVKGSVSQDDTGPAMIKLEFLVDQDTATRLLETFTTEPA